MLHIRVVAGPKTGEEIRTRLDSVLTVGRSKECRLVLDDRKTSRVHGEFFVAEGQARYRDLLSHNGSRIASQDRGKVWLGPLFPEWEIRTGDRITIGETEIEVLQVETTEADVTNDLKGEDTVELEIHKTMALDASALATGEMQRFSEFLRMTPDVSTSLESIKSDLCDALLAVYPAAECAAIVDIPSGHRESESPGKLDFETLTCFHARRSTQSKVTCSRHVLGETYRKRGAVYFSGRHGLPDVESVVRESMNSCLCSPLWSDQAIVGFLHLHTVEDRGRPFTHGDAQLFSFLSRVTSLLLSQARSAREQAALRAFATAGQVVAGLGHDARAILSTLGLQVGNLEESVTGLVDSPFWNHLRNDLDLLAFLSRDTMDRLTAGSGQLAPQPNDIHAVVEDVLKRSARYFLKDPRDTRIELMNACPPGAQACVDQHGLMLALLNCVKNAIDAMAADVRDGVRSGGRIRVTGVLEKEAADELYVLSVCDDAGGISAGVLERLGEPLVSTKGPEGSGLGMFLVFDLVRRMSGRIRIATSAAASDEFPAGTVFSLCFPTGAAEFPDAAEDTPLLQVMDQYNAYRRQFDKSI